MLPVTWHENESTVSYHTPVFEPQMLRKKANAFLSMPPNEKGHREKVNSITPVYAFN